jgi:hypothetical protein
LEHLGLHNKPKAEVHPGHKLTGSKEEEEEEVQLKWCAVIELMATENMPLINIYQQIEIV